MHTTRLLVLALALACVACSGAGTGPSGVPASIAGNWSSWPPHQAPTPGGPMVFDLTESGDAVSGVNSFGVARWSVSGQYVRPNITLTSTVGDHVTIWAGKA